MICSQCKHSSPTDAKFCSQCAFSLTQGCVECGSSIPSNSVFCHFCAHKVDRDDDEGTADNLRAVKQIDQIGDEPAVKRAEGGGWLTGLVKLAPLVQGVLLAAVGTTATILYNERQLQLTQLSALDKYRGYLASENPQERVFGYEAFVALGQEKFVIRLIGANSDKAGEQVLAELAKSSESDATREEAQAKLDKLLVGARESAELGRHEKAKEKLNQAVKISPNNTAARLRRGDVEDWQYLVDEGATESSEPYTKLAQYLAEQGRAEEGYELLKRALTMFDDVSAFDVSFEYDPVEIDMEEISNSLTYTVDEGSWARPPVELGVNSFPLYNRLIVWSVQSEPRNLDLAFSRYGLAPVTVNLNSNDLVRPEIAARQIEVEMISLPDGVSLSGKIGLAGPGDLSGATAVIFDSYYENRGFYQSALIAADGSYTLEGVPEGRFEIALEKDGFVQFGINVELKNGELTCLVDGTFYHSTPGIRQCNLADLGIVLHPVRLVTLQWTLQEDASKNHFRETVSSSSIQLSSALSNEWWRGDWDCCDGSYKFGSKEINASTFADVVVYTDPDGRIYFGQPNSNQFVAEVTDDYDTLTEVPAGLNFKGWANVEVGKTYVIKTNVAARGVDNAKRYLAKVTVLAIE
jgi:tetratricopeptide (TPR) repeat protein